MYIIKTIFYDAICQRVDIRNGLIVNDVDLLEGKAEILQRFWNESYIYFGEGINFSELENYNGKKLLSFAKHYKFDDDKFYFWVEKNESINKEGYIIFIKHVNSEIKTDGTIICEKYTTNTAILLQDGNYIEIDNNKIEVVNNQLMMHI